jgi:hypothetical protein
MPPSHHEAWSVPHSRQDRPFTIDRNDSRLVAKLTAELRRSPRVFTFVHLALPDQTGHAHGFASKQYLDAVQRTDQMVGRILKNRGGPPCPAPPDARPHHPRPWGDRATHNEARKLQNYRIPFIAWNPGVAAGRNLYGLNQSLKSPGASRTNYRGKQPIRNADIANLVTDALDLPRVPGSKFNRSRKLTVFR